jgi:hypothetical protein
MEIQKEYNLRYLLAKIRTKRGKVSDRIRQLANKRNKNQCRKSSDIGGELENHNVGRVHVGSERVNKIWPPDDEQDIARNMYMYIVINVLTICA